MMRQLPRPKAVFNEKMSKEQRQVAYEEYIDWINCRSMLISRREILAEVMKYAKASLINYKGIFHSTDVARFKTFNEIMEKADLLKNELLFQQFVINKMREITDETSSLKKAVLPLAEKQRERLWDDLRSEADSVAGGLFVLGCGAWFVDGCMGTGMMVLGCAGPYFSKQIAEWRINVALERHLALIAACQPDLEEDFNDAVWKAAAGVNKVATVVRHVAIAAKSVGSLFGLFAAEEKRSERAVLTSEHKVRGVRAPQN